MEEMSSYLCPFCGEIFKDEASLFEHSDGDKCREFLNPLNSLIEWDVKKLQSKDKSGKAKKGPKRYFACGDCNKEIFTTAIDFLKHRKDVHERNDQLKKCAKCEYTVKADHRSNLINHLQNSHKSGLYYCTDCEFEARGKHLMVAHLIEVHGYKNGKFGCNIQILSLGDGEIKISHQCPSCNQSFASKDIFLNHEHEDKIPASQQKKQSKTKIKEDELLIKCKFCAYVIKKISSTFMCYHLQEKHKIEMYSCAKCDFSGNTQKEVIEHQSQKHNEENPIYEPNFVHAMMRNGEIKPACCKCKQTFDSEEEFSDHEVFQCKFSRKAKAFKCHKCEEKFVSLKKRDEHAEVVHQNSFPCNKCDETFSKKKLMKSHVKMNHAQDIKTRIREQLTVEPDSFQRVQNSPLICPECGVKCDGKSTMYDHFMTDHLDFECNECDEAFATSHDLFRHFNSLHVRISVL